MAERPFSIQSKQVEKVEDVADERVRTLRYLGNKRKLVFSISALIREKCPKGSIVLDLFAGTNCVGHSLMKEYEVWTNDNMHFSHTISKGLVANPGVLLTRADIDRKLESSYQQNYLELSQAFRTWLLEEECYLSNIDVAKFQEYAEFCSSYPHFGVSADLDTEFGRYISKEVTARRAIPKTKPYLLFTTYFAMGYFSLRQSIQIDSLRYAIDDVLSGAEREKCMTALIYAVDSCVSSTGHFAQFRKVRSESTFRQVAKERTKDVMDLFNSAIDQLFSRKTPAPYANIAWCMDYSDLLIRLERLESKKPTLIYADPPFTADHYSRFYHVLETMTLYDYPISEFSGRYRGDRQKSDFSSKVKALDEFESLVSRCSALGSDLLLSYTDDGLVASSELIRLFKKFYTMTEIHWKIRNHSNQGRSSETCTRRKARRREYLIYGSNTVRGKNV